MKKECFSIKVVGIGATGVCILDQMAESGILGLETIAIHTDAARLLRSKAERRKCFTANENENREVAMEVFRGADLLIFVGDVWMEEAQKALKYAQETKVRLFGILEEPCCLKNKDNWEAFKQGLDELFVLRKECAGERNTEEILCEIFQEISDFVRSDEGECVGIFDIENVLKNYGVQGDMKPANGFV